ncbi:6-phosphofructokinase [Intestinimonas sp. MSJ-38]|uniref:6-phosphofructokinase n=1 Tax=Intestinimonas sp. MSJ-38 TaxID=2841532 RepID=UPI001C0FCC1A|nr:6-phosphofructokinase [Intestinimonas sp. MSJ-38]MBU5432169.1 6-phosphofructokinase [Intestinimonas sp. MSJ-38]
MNKLKGACLFGQSGGPTSVINSSALGVLETALGEDCITAVYGCAHGIKGILNDCLYDISQEDKKELSLLRYTPSSALGSCRYKLKDSSVDDTDYKRILEIFQKYNIRYFFYNGGNDSMDTCNKVSKYLMSQGYECRIMGVPKTIDNDLFGTDHCPGFGSAAKYIATSCMEIYQDANVYDTGTVVIVEIMGRNAGWLTAASALASHMGGGPDLIYLPEQPFDLEAAMAQIKEVYDRRNNCLVALSEGIMDKNGKFIAEYGQDVATDAFGHKQMGGAGAFVANEVKSRFGYKVRSIELSLLQRCAAHSASLTDIEEAYQAGKTAVELAVSGVTDKMVAFERKEGAEYQLEMKPVPLDIVANTEKKVPTQWIKPDHTGLTDDFIAYALPLIQGETQLPYENGLPRFARLKKVLAK